VLRITCLADRIIESREWKWRGLKMRVLSLIATQIRARVVCIPKETEFPGHLLLRVPARRSSTFLHG
jgi:hypothetical protein